MEGLLKETTSCPSNASFGSVTEARLGMSKPHFRLIQTTFKNDVMRKLQSTSVIIRSSEFGEFG